jgi:hypothetical protein
MHKIRQKVNVVGIVTLAIICSIPLLILPGFFSIVLYILFNGEEQEYKELYWWESTIAFVFGLLPGLCLVVGFILGSIIQERNERQEEFLDNI